MGLFSLISLRLGKQALASFVTVCCVLANLFVLKQISLFGLTASASDSYSIGAILGLNLLQEYYGRKEAQKAILISFILLLLYCIGSLLHLAYIPVDADSMHNHYGAILTNTPRIIAASLAVYVSVQYCDTWLYSTLNRYWNGKRLVLRNGISIVLCQLLDTIFFSYLGLYGLVHNIQEIIIVSFIVKLCAISATLPFIALSKKIHVPKQENA